MNGFISFIERAFVPIAARIGAQRHLVAIRDGFAMTMPLILTGAIAVLLNNLPIDAFQNMMLNVSERWKGVNGSAWEGTFAILALLVTMSIAYQLARSYEGVDPLAASLISLGSFIIIAPRTGNETYGIDFGGLGSQGLFVSLLVALLVTELFRFLMQTPFLRINMPAGVPPAVARSFEALFPGIITLYVVSLVQWFVAGQETTIHAWINTTIQKPLQGLSDTLPAAIIVAILVHLLWFFGLHGANIIQSITNPIFLANLEENIAMYDKTGDAGSDKLNIVTQPFFDVFVFMGGSGTTLALLLAVLLVAKSKQYRQVASISTVPGLFNINEPVIFGMPIILNPVLLLPWIIVPTVLTTITYFAMTSGFVPKTVALVPWTLPPIFSGWMVTGGNFMGALLQVINFAVAFAIYLPFVIASDKVATRNEAEAEAALKA
ncbi:MAG: PTS cellobiose transporter subunit IIC [Bacilli bacterium]